MDKFNLSDTDDIKPFYELENYVLEYAPEFRKIMDRLLRRENVDVKEINEIMDVLTDVIVPYAERGGGFTSPKMAHLHATLVAVGKQL